MSESENFTIDDAENDGKIKREAGSMMQSVAARDSGQLYQYFKDVCEHEGREPADSFGDGILKAINNEEFAKSVASIDIDMSKIMSGQTRVEDAKEVKKLSEELGIETNDDHWLKDAIKDKIKRKTESPIPRLNKDKVGGKDVDQDVRRELNEIKNQVNKLASAVEENQSMDEDVRTEKSVDDLFEGVGDTDNEEDGTEDEVEEEVEEIEENKETVSVEPDVAVTAQGDVEEDELPSSSDGVVDDG